MKTYQTSEIKNIVLVGGAGSGKTTLTNRLKERFGDHVSVVYHDSYARCRVLALNLLDRTC